VWRSGRDGAALELCVHLQPLSRCQDWLPDHSFDAIYFDPFCPANNADLWTEEVFARMHDCMAPTGKLVSYCVSSRVRAALVRCGFEVDRLAGPPGGKREVLIAKRAESGAAREEPAAPADGR
jgi:tRNA U34 5-methylaminomethyl-2-thiouridine-forming methyltransferase MnmC